MSVAPPLDGPLLAASAAVATARSDARSGRVRAAIAMLEPLLRASVTWSPDERIAAIEIVIDAHLALGDLRAAIAWDTTMHLDSADLPLEAVARGHFARGELASAMDQPDSALDEFCAAGAAGADLAVPHLAWRSGAALALVRLGRRREALAHARDHLALVHSHQTDPAAVALALRTLATAESDGFRVTRLIEARGLLVDGHAPRLRAQLDTDLAGLLVLEGRLVEAMEILREVERFASSHHLSPLLGRARRLIERLGETPRRRETEALGVLTAAERRVALLALDGLTNRDIAASLVISVKAVEGHLSRIYRKLGITSRAALLDAVGVRL
ncbi:MAG: LuxR C-terminal-related transcriptional regulator [Nocardioides sp.]